MVLIPGYKAVIITNKIQPESQRCQSTNVKECDANEAHRSFLAWTKKCIKKPKL